MTGRKFPPPLLQLFAGGLLALPLLAPMASAGGSPTLGALLRAAFAGVCHQIPERSFTLFGEPVAVCHRCLGLYAGGLAGLLLLPWLPRVRRWLVERPRRLGWFVLPLLFDVALPFGTWWSRFGSGLLASFPVAAIVWVAWEEIFRRREPATSTREPAPG